MPTKDKVLRGERKVLIIVGVDCATIVPGLPRRISGTRLSAILPTALVLDKGKVDAVPAPRGWDSEGLKGG